MAITIIHKGQILCDVCLKKIAEISVSKNVMQALLEEEQCVITCESCNNENV